MKKMVLFFFFALLLVVSGFSYGKSKDADVKSDSNTTTSLSFDKGHGINPLRYGFAITSSVLLGMGIGNSILGDGLMGPLFLGLDLLMGSLALSAYAWTISYDTSSFVVSKYGTHPDSSKSYDGMDTAVLVTYILSALYIASRVSQLVLVLLKPFSGDTENIAMRKSYGESRQNFVSRYSPNLMRSSRDIKSFGLGYTYSF